MMQIGFNSLTEPNDQMSSNDWDLPLNNGAPLGGAAPYFNAIKNIIYFTA